jgi:hypothetical protein
MKLPRQPTAIQLMFFSAYGVLVGSVYGLIINVALLGSWLVGIPLCVGLATVFGVFGWSSARSSESNWQRLIIIPFAPFAFCAALFGIGVFFLMVAILWPFSAFLAFRRASIFRRAMMDKGRYATLAELRPRLLAGDGTLIEETAEKGPFRIWWTEDDLLKLGSPVETPDEFVAVLHEQAKHPFNTKCLQEYLSEVDGKALLTSLPPRYARSGRISKMFPRAKRAVVIRPYASTEAASPDRATVPPDGK